MKKIDFHVHILDHVTAEQSIENFADLIKRKGYCGVGIMSCVVDTQENFPTNNEDALFIASQLDESYAFASLHHDKDFVEQTKEYMNGGFCGIKMLEGKPSIIKKLGYDLSHPKYEPFFAYCEKEQIPIVLHNNDPEKNWDITKCSQRAIQNGWVYDDTYLSYQEYFSIMEQNVLLKFPNLKLALAHFGFYSDDLERADKLMQACPNLYMDITPAPIIFEQLSLDTQASRDFFLRYADRIYYGTDAENNLVGESRIRNDTKTELMQFFLEESGEKQVGKYLVRGINLPFEVLEKIYYKNAMNFISKK